MRYGSTTAAAPRSFQQELSRSQQETDNFHSDDSSRLTAARRAALDRFSPRCPRPDGTFFVPSNIPGPCSRINRVLCPPATDCVRSDLGYHVCCPLEEEDPLKISGNLPAIEETHETPNVPIVEVTKGL